MKFLQSLDLMLQSGNRPGTNWRAISGPDIDGSVFKYQNGYYLRAHRTASPFTSTRRVLFYWSTDAITWISVNILSSTSVPNTVDIATDGVNIFTYYHDSSGRIINTYNTSGGLQTTNTYSTGSGGALRVDTRSDGKSLAVGPYELATFTATNAITFTYPSLNIVGRSVNIGTTSLIFSYSGGTDTFVDGTTNGTSLNLTQGVGNIGTDCIQLGIVGYDAFNPSTALAQCVVLKVYVPPVGDPEFILQTFDITLSGSVLAFVPVNTWSAAALSLSLPANPTLGTLIVHPITGDLFVTVIASGVSYLLRSMNKGLTWEIIPFGATRIVYSPLGLVMINTFTLYVSP